MAPHQAPGPGPSITLGSCSGHSHTAGPTGSSQSGHVLGWWRWVRPWRTLGLSGKGAAGQSQVAKSGSQSLERGSAGWKQGKTGWRAGRGFGAHLIAFPQKRTPTPHSHPIVGRDAPGNFLILSCLSIKLFYKTFLGYVNARILIQMTFISHHKSTN